MTTTRLTQLFSFLNDEPNDPFLIYAIATEYNVIGNTDEALKYYLILIENHPNYVGTYYHLGKLYQKLALNLQAIATFEKGFLVANAAKNKHAANELRGALDELLDED